MKYATSEIVFSLWSDAEELLALAHAVGEDERGVRKAIREVPRNALGDLLQLAQWQDSCERLLGQTAAAQNIREIANRIQWRLEQLQDDLRLRPRKSYKLTPNKMKAILKWYRTKKGRKTKTALAEELGLSRQSVYTAIKLIETNWDKIEKMTNPDAQHDEE